MIPFNKPAVTGNEFAYMQEACDRGKLSGNGYFSKRCSDLLTDRYGFEKVLLTTSCTDALEMAAILCNIETGDEVIMPSFTFPSCANAFILRGARVIFADTEAHSPNIDAAEIEKKITSRTKALLIVHYTGAACNMDAIMQIVRKHNILLIEDCAHAIDSYYDGKPLGSFGDLAAFSFHETKNIQCGEGGMLVVNNIKYAERADIIWEKGTNRVAFAENKIAHYNWVDIGSSFLMSELQAAFLYAQLENIEAVQIKRKTIWQEYFTAIQNSGPEVKAMLLAGISINNASIFYLLCKPELRPRLLAWFKQHDILAVSHYLPLHFSPWYLQNNAQEKQPFAERFSSSIIRLPLYYSLEPDMVKRIIDTLTAFYHSEASQVT